VQGGAELKQKVFPEVENKENPTSWATKNMKYLDNKFIVAVKRCIWEQIERIQGSLISL